MPESFKTTYHRCQLIDTEKRKDFDFIRLAGMQKDLIFDKRFLNHAFRPKWFETPFKNIRYCFPREAINSNYSHFLEPMPFRNDNIVDFTKDLVRGTKNYLLQTLKKDKKYLFMHSGGYDSRIISACLMDLWREGARWDIHFRCHQPEEPMFLEIMKREGWPKSMYSVYPGKKINYYDLGNKKDVLNGWQRYTNQMNFWSDIIINEKDYIAMTGLGGELFKYYVTHKKDPYPKRCNNNALNILLAFNPNEGQWSGLWLRRFEDLIMPKFGYSYLEYSLTINPAWCKFDGETDNIRKEMCRRFDYDITDIPHGVHDYSWNLNDEFFRKMEEDFYTSRFYRDWGSELSKKPDFKKIHAWDSELWGFMTVYDEVFNN